jgi:hypothetical protein
MGDRRVTADASTRIIRIDIDGKLGSDDTRQIEREYQQAQTSLGAGAYGELVVGENFIPPDDKESHDAFSRMIGYTDQSDCVAVARVVNILAKMQIDRLSRQVGASYPVRYFDSEDEAVTWLVEQLRTA